MFGADTQKISSILFTFTDTSHVLNFRKHRFRGINFSNSKKSNIWKTDAVAYGYRHVGDGQWREIY